MRDLERWEIRAQAFHIMTGIMAPGKDYPMGSYPPSDDKRMELWMAWKKLYDKCVNATIEAYEEIMGVEDV